MRAAAVFPASQVRKNKCSGGDGVDGGGGGAVSPGGRERRIGRLIDCDGPGRGPSHRPGPRDVVTVQSCPAGPA